MAGPLPTPEEEAAPKRPLWSRLGWLVAIWAASIAALAVVAGILRFVMGLAGLRP
jgi:hypothetical protein